MEIKKIPVSFGSSFSAGITFTIHGEEGGNKVRFKRPFSSKIDFMKEEMRQTLIDYIKTNDNHYVQTNFHNHSLTVLVMMKTSIEIRIAQQKKMNKKR